MKSLKCFILYHLGPGGPSEGSSCELTKSSKSAAGVGARDIFAFVSRIDFFSHTSDFAFRSTIYIIWATKLADADEPLNSPPSLHGAKYIGKCIKVAISRTVGAAARKEAFLNSLTIYMFF